MYEVLMLNIIIAYIFISTRNGFISTHFDLALVYPISAGWLVMSLCSAI
ncbi:hypothetical protein XBKQ1_330032 [Xenorhabdus bovienii str. kraussei Quebec]|uniref:Uncharacterized protein n=1 Tax=Xenorhabdus bovienii str. kraussei Quebec TaxID=1398203 RepID=A0A077PKZ4_XENBV|nr:hypothetical protein XBKQ1_330032 [Xenorhabdus bovienii str. kraussei Quebec]